MKKVMKCMAGILALTLAFAQVAPVSVFAEETTAATEEAQAVYSGDCSAEGSSVTWTYNQTEKTLTFSGTGAIKDYQASGEALPWLSASDTYNVRRLSWKKASQACQILRKKTDCLIWKAMICRAQSSCRKV